MRSIRDLLKPLAALPILAALLFGPLAHSAIAQNFAQPKVIVTGNWPVAVYTGDFDGDGNSDLLYLEHVPNTPAGQPDTLVKIVYGDGNGNFSAPVLQGSLNSANSLAVNVADVNADGKTDMFYAQANGSNNVPSTVGVWFGNASRTLQTPPAYTTLSAGAGTFSQIVGFPLNTYISNDSTIIVLNSAGSATVFTYTLGALRPVLGLVLPDGAGPAVATDVNGDGVPDLVVLGQPTGTVDVFLTSRNLDPYHAPLRFPVAGIHSLLVQDVNFDGIPDLIAEGPNGHIDVFPGNGDGTFQTTSIGGTGPLDGTTGNGGHLIVAADLNHDGQLDALTATPAGISTLLGQGTQYLGLGGIYNAGPVGASGHPSYVTADFNHDGYLDLAVDSPEGIAILFGNPDGSFQTSKAFAAGKPAMSSTTGVFTASGKVDAAVSISSTTAQLLFGQGDGTFVAAPTPVLTQTANPALWGTIAAADFNNDGKLDLVVTADGPAAALPALGFGVTFGYGQGDGTFNVPSLLNTHANPGGITFFGTGAAGPALGPSGSPGFVVLDQQHLWDIYNLPAPTGLSATAIDAIADTHAHNLVVAGNLHGGTLPDLIVQDEGSLKLYLNSPAGFAATPSGDLSVDGSLTTPGRALAPALSSTFGGTVPVSAGGLGFPAAIGSAVIADLDGDANNDLLVAYDNMGADHTAPNSTTAPNSIYIWYGSSGGKFLATAKHPVNPLILIPERNNYQLAIADINGDKIPDLIMSDGYVITVAYGIGDGTFGAEKHFIAGQGINTISAADVNGDGKLDLIIANGGAVLTNPVANKDMLAANPDVNTGGITVLLNQTPAALLPTSLSLILCVDDPGSLFPCANPIGNTPLISPITMYYGQVLDGVAVESSIALTGTITFYDGTRIFCTISANLAGIGPTGNACPTNSGDFHAGNRSVDAVYSGDTANAPSTSNSIAVNVFPDLTTAALSSSSNPAALGSSITFTASISGNFAVPTGTVQFFDGSSLLGSGMLDGTGSATFTTSTLAAGTHPVTVVYPGTTDFNPVTSAILRQVIVSAPVAGSLSATPEPSVIGSAFTITATVVPPTGSATPPSGSVVFSVDGAAIGTAALSAGIATTPGPTTLAVGTHSLTAAYSGDANYLPSSALAGTHTVVLSPTSTVLVAVGPTTIYFNQPANSDYRTIVADPVNHPATGTATVQDNGVSISYCIGIPYGSTCPYAAGGTNRLTVGTHSLVVLYNGDSFNAPSASAALVFTVLPDLTTATLTSSNNPANLNSPVTFTASLGGNPAIPSGSVNFYDGTTLLATVTLDTNGNAAFTISTLALGTHPITVAYAGTTNFNPVTSAILNQVIVNPPGTFTLTVSPDPIAIAVGRTGLLLVTVRSNGSFAQAVQLSCSGLAMETACTFVQPLIPIGGASTTLELATSAPHDCGDPNHPYFLGSAHLPPSTPRWVPEAAAFLYPSLLLLGLGCTRARRRLRGAGLTLLLLGLSLAGLSSLSGCGRCTDLGTHPGQYTFTITATAQGGPVTETASQTVHLQVILP